MQCDCWRERVESGLVIHSCLFSSAVPVASCWLPVGFPLAVEHETLKSKRHRLGSSRSTSWECSIDNMIQVPAEQGVLIDAW